MSRPLFSSWVVPFALGVSTTLSLVWLSGRFLSVEQPPTSTFDVNNQSQSRSTTTSTSTAQGSSSQKKSRSLEPSSLSSNDQTTAPTSLSRPPPASTTTPSLMDSTDLDHRLLRKAEAVLQWRTTRLVVVVERCTNDHNYSAILRTAEALGIQHVYMIDPPTVVVPPPAAAAVTVADTGTTAAGEDMQQELMTLENDDDDDDDDQQRYKSNNDTNLKKSKETTPSLASLSQDQQRKLNMATPEEIQARRDHHLFAQKATQWLTVHDYETSQECVSELRRQGYQLWVTDLGQEAECLTMESPEIPHKVALVMGTEAVGCSQYLLDQADKRVYLPLRGYADSLNLSVATALIVHQLFVMDPTLIGAMDESERVFLRTKWFTKLCQQRLLTRAQRKERRRLQGLVQKCQSLYDRSTNPAARRLQPSEQEKLQNWDIYKEELSQLEALVDPQKVEAAVQDWVQHPPAPLTDIRRADEHRICYVGKNTKTMHGDDWKDMVATSNAASKHMATAAAMREKVLQQQQQEQQQGNSTS